MTNTTRTLLAINTAVRTADGWYDATERNTARFCTESLLDAAESCLAGLTVGERDKFAYNGSRTFHTRDRVWALNMLCSYAHAMRLREWGEAFTAARAAAAAELPAALELLGMSL